MLPCLNHSVKQLQQASKQRGLHCRLRLLQPAAISQMHDQRLPHVPWEHSATCPSQVGGQALSFTVPLMLRERAAGTLHSRVRTTLPDSLALNTGQKSCWQLSWKKKKYHLLGGEWGIFYYLQLQAIWKVYKALTGVFVLVPLHCFAKSDRWYLN